jgi:hypothetical protein
MDRVIVQPGALPQDVDILYSGKFGLLGQAYQNMAVLGTTTVVAGLAATPTSPTADLHVTVGVGTIYQMDPTDASAYGTLGVDNTNVMKQGINATPQVLTITPPGTAGFSQVYLVQAILSDIDGGSTVLSYYNSANPAQPFSGPANAGTSNFTTRTCVCTIALKAGSPATTGTQTAPSPDAGYVGLYTVTVTNGQTQITSSNIAQLATAPFFPTLPGVPVGVQLGTWVWGGSDTGAANAYVITCSPIPSAYKAGMGVRFKATNANSGASTINVNGLGTVAIKRAGGAAVATGDILSGQVVSLVHDGVNFQMENYTGASGAQTVTNNSVGVPYVVDTGASNALIGTYSPAIGSYVAGLTIAIKLANTVTGAFTINCNGLGVKNVKLGDITDPLPNIFPTGMVLLLIYDGTQFQVCGFTSNTYRKPTANTTIYVNTAIGNDANDGVSNTSGHALATIQGGVNKAFSYAPSQYTITIVVEPGLYNEAVATPLYAGPAIIIDGLNSANVGVSSGAANCFVVQGPNTMTVKNLTIQNSGGGNWAGFEASNGATMLTVNTISNSIVGGVFMVSNGASVSPGNHSFAGSSNSLFQAQYGGNIQLSAVTFTIASSISVSIATGLVDSGGSIAISGSSPPSFVNGASVNGPKYNARNGGIINSGGLGFSVLPGSVGGSVSNNGVYVP